MITQSQYFDIEEYLQRECRIIEPALLEELIDHFMDGIEGVENSDDDFERAFELVKADFGGKVGVRKIQRTYQFNILKNYRAGIIAEFLSYFQRPYLWRTLLYALVSAVVIFYFNLRLLRWGETDLWDGTVQGGIAGGVFVLLLCMVINKFEFGTFKPQARNWFSFLCSAFFSLFLIIGSALLELFSVSVLPQVLTLILFVAGSLSYLAIFRYSHRELYPDPY